MDTAVIFDLDDLLADTERLHFAAYRQALGEVGTNIDDVTYTNHWIFNGHGIADFCRTHSLSCDPDAVRQRKQVIYAELVTSSVRAMPGAAKLITRLHGKRRLAVATSSYAGAAGVALRTLSFLDYFEHVVSGSDVDRVKPAPDLFLLAAARLNIAPARCVVLEDSAKGVRAVLAAGMAAIAVPSVRTRENDFTGASHVLNSLHNVTDDLLDSLLKPA